jgi:hypothetical protein
VFVTKRVGVRLGVSVARGDEVGVGVLVFVMPNVGVGLGEDVPSLVGEVVPVVTGLGVAVAKASIVGVCDLGVGDSIPPLVGVSPLGGVLEGSGPLGNGETTD